QQWQLQEHHGETLEAYRSIADIDAFMTWARQFQEVCENKQLISLVDCITRISQYLERDEKPALPLDENRAGFALTQLGAAVLLERVAPGNADSDTAQHETRLLDTAVAADAYDLIRPDPTMTTFRRLAHRMFRHRPIAMLHPHVPGTRDHDPAELAALADVFTESRGSGAMPTSSWACQNLPPSLGENRGAGPINPRQLQTQQPHHDDFNRQSEIDNRQAVDLYAAKGALGHGLGAAGLTSLIIAHLILRTGKRPPMPWLRDPIAAPNGLLRISPDTADCDIHGTHAIFAAGFGGHLAAAAIHRDKPEG
ncbi:MAG: hypothetical protein MI741_20100, partial [Rhodospirillales bacterium]|nr:hypothetical protein [Rhodospirillales bacterium]